MNVVNWNTKGIKPLIKKDIFYSKSFLNAMEYVNPEFLKYFLSQKEKTVHLENLANNDDCKWTEDQIHSMIMLTANYQLIDALKKDYDYYKSLVEITKFNLRTSWRRLFTPKYMEKAKQSIKEIEAFNANN